MQAVIRNATVDDIEPIAARCRCADRRELWQGWGQVPREALAESLQRSVYVKIGMVNGIPLCMFGVTPISTTTGRPWMIATQDIERYQGVFLRRCKDVVFEMHEHFNVLTNIVSVENTLSRMWLKWIGFIEFGKPVEGIYGGQFQWFMRSVRQQ